MTLLVSFHPLGPSQAYARPTAVLVDELNARRLKNSMHCIAVGGGGLNRSIERFSAPHRGDPQYCLLCQLGCAYPNKGAGGPKLGSR